MKDAFLDMKQNLQPTVRLDVAPRWLAELISPTKVKHTLNFNLMVSKVRYTN